MKFPEFRCKECTLVRNFQPDVMCWECEAHNFKTIMTRIPEGYVLVFSSTKFPAIIECGNCTKVSWAFHKAPYPGTNGWLRHCPFCNYKEEQQGGKLKITWATKAHYITLPPQPTA